MIFDVSAGYLPKRVIRRIFFILTPLCFYVNEREEFMQEIQYTQQTATRTAQNQDKKTT